MSVKKYVLVPYSTYTDMVNNRVNVLDDIPHDTTTTQTPITIQQHQQYPQLGDKPVGGGIHTPEGVIPSPPTPHETLLPSHNAVVGGTRTAGGVERRERTTRVKRVKQTAKVNPTNKTTSWLRI
jgi:hypothetical protein